MAERNQQTTEAEAEEELLGSEHLTIRPMNMMQMAVPLRGIAPYMQARFSQKAMAMMHDKQEAGQVARGKKEHKPRDFDDDYRSAMHLDAQGRNGIPAAAFRNAMIDACRMVGYKMTMAKMSVFIVPDVLDALDGTPLVLIHGTPERIEMAVRNFGGVADLRVRPLWREWSCTLQLRWDADQFTQNDVINLLVRAGQQVGIGEGRPFSKKSAGMQFGMFEHAITDGVFIMSS